MTSAIDATKPTSGSADTVDVRANFAAARAEILALQSDLGALQAKFVITASKILTLQNSLTLAGTDGTVITFPAVNATIAALNVGQTFTEAHDTTKKFGYATGAGGTVAQATSKSTGVTLNKVCGDITMDAASLAANTSVGFTLTNSEIAATDDVRVQIISGGTTNSYIVQSDAVAAGSCNIHLRNITGGALAEAVVIRFTVTKGATS